MGKSEMQSSRGFSLVELLSIMVFVTVLSSFALFSWDRYTANQNLRAAAADMEADILLMRKKAMSDSGIGGSHYTIYFDMDHNNYIMKDTMTDAGGNVVVTTIGTKTPASFAPKIKIYEIGLTSSFGTQQAGNVTIDCEGRGTLSPLAGHIALQNKLESIANVTYNQTGRTYVTYIYK
jgi:Tfp pilus assembly protein PilE